MACASIVILLAGAAEGLQVKDDYRVGPRDVLGITVWDEPGLTSKVTLRADGSFVFPLIGDVKAAGLTVSEIETGIRERLAEGFLQNPQVTVTVLDYQSQRVFAVGEVMTPGTVPLTGQMTLLESLARAGGLTDAAGTPIVVLRRSDTDGPGNSPVLPGQPGVKEVARVPLQALQSGQVKENVVLRDGDTIFVPRAEQVYVLGEVKNPGPVAFAPAITVFRAISLAGGMSDLGSSGRIRIVRIVRGEKQEFKAKFTDVLEPGDTIMVPARWF